NQVVTHFEPSWRPRLSDGNRRCLNRRSRKSLPPKKSWSSQTLCRPKSYGPRLNLKHGFRRYVSNSISYSGRTRLFALDRVQRGPQARNPKRNCTTETLGAADVGPGLAPA